MTEAARRREILRRLQEAIEAGDGPAMERLSGERPDPFRVLVACILSLRTRDEVTEPASLRLFALADSAAALVDLPVEVIEKAIYPSAFYRTKAAGLKTLSACLLERWAGQVPETLGDLLALPGVGLKTANLVLSLGHGQDAICVDTHVHRISNRLGIIDTHTPDETEAALRRVIPRPWWRRLNRLMVRYGQTICQPLSPRCSECRLLPLCPQRGVRHQR